MPRRRGPPHWPSTPPQPGKCRRWPTGAGVAGKFTLHIREELEIHYTSSLDIISSVIGVVLVTRTKGEPVTLAVGRGIPKTGVLRYLHRLVVAFLLLAKLLPKFVNQSVSSSLTLTSGVKAHKPQPGWSVMVAAGAAAEGLTRGLAVDLSPLRVNAVFPGAVHTELFRNISEDHLPSVLDKFKQSSITGTVGKPEEAAEAYLQCMKNSFRWLQILPCYHLLSAHGVSLPQEI